MDKLQNMPAHIMNKLTNLAKYVKEGMTKERAAKRVLEKFYKAYFKETRQNVTKKEFKNIIKAETIDLIEYLNKLEDEHKAELNEVDETAEIFVEDAVEEIEEIEVEAKFEAKEVTIL